mgnify:CR=1 FL=1
MYALVLKPNDESIMHSFQMQEQKSQIYNVNVDSNGNTELEDRIKRELQISPIVVINNKKWLKLSQQIF